MKRIFARALLAMIAATTLAGCVTVSPDGRVFVGGQPQVMERISTVRGDALMRRLPEGGFDLGFLDDDVILTPRPQIENPRLVKTGSVGDETAIVVGGSRPGCPVAYLMIMIGREKSYATTAGDCLTAVNFSASDEGLLAEQAGVDDPLMWWAGQGRVAGGKRYSVIKAENERAHAEQALAEKARTEQEQARARSNRPTTSRKSRSAPDRPAGRDVATRTPAPEIAAPRLDLPARIRTVGDDVVPDAVEITTAKRAAPTLVLDK